MTGHPVETNRARKGEPKLRTRGFGTAALAGFPPPLNAGEAHAREHTRR